MIRRHPGSSRTVSLFPDTTFFRFFFRCFPPPGGLALPCWRPPFTFWRFSMSLVVNDSCVEPRFASASQSDDWIIRQAIALLGQRVFKKEPSLERIDAVKDYLRPLKLAAEPNEIFAIVFLNSMHEVLAYEPIF